jgi:hypothetical protein
MANGFKTGGRQKGTPNKKTVERDRILRERGMTSLSYLQSVYCDKSKDVHLRVEAAKAALPYEHSRKPTDLKLGSGDGSPFVVEVVNFEPPPSSS